MYADPKKYVSQVDDIWFKSKDGTKLNGWWLRSASKVSKGTIVFFHGNAQNISSHFLNLAWIANYDYNVFIFDYRGFGKSKGSPDQRGINKDALSALEEGFKLHSSITPKGKFIVYGQSLSGIISMRSIIDFKNKDKIDLVVQDSTFMSYKKIAYDKLKGNWLSFVFSPLAFVLVSDEYASDVALKKIKNPMLVIIGLDDKHVNPKFGKEIFNESRSKKKWLWKIEDWAHVDVFVTHGGGVGGL